MTRRRTRSRLFAAAAATLPLFTLPPLFAADTPHYYVGPSNSLFSDPASWSLTPHGPGGSPPAAGDLAYVTPSTFLSISLDASPNNVPLHLLSLAGSAPLDPLLVSTASLSTLTTDSLLIGPNATLSHSAGLITGDSSGNPTLAATVSGPNSTYSLSASATLQLSSLTVGLDAPGTLAQSGGTLAFSTLNSPTFTLAANPGSSASYKLSAGTVSFSQSPSTFTVADSGSASVTQSGGTLGNPAVRGALNATPFSLYLAKSPNSSASYSLSGFGTLYAGTEYLANSGSATFTQSGGTHAVNSTLYLAYNPGSSATYNLSAGSLTSSDLHLAESGSATLNLSGGTLTTYSLSLANSPGSSATLNLTGGTLTVSRPTPTGQVILGNSGAATINHSGGTLDLSSYLLYTTLGPGSSYSLSGSGTLRTYALLVNSTLTQSGGYLSSAGTLYLGANGPATISQTGGAASISDLLIGGTTTSGASRYTLNATPPTYGPNVDFYNTLTLDGPAPTSFDQLAGSVNAGYVFLGRNASYTFAGPNTLAISGALAVGGAPAPYYPASYPSNAGATFTSSGHALYVGSNALTGVQDAITVNADTDGSPALFNLAGDLYFPYNNGLTVGSTTTGTFVQTAGTISPPSPGSTYPDNIPLTITLGKSAGATGTYLLSGQASSVTTNDLVIGDAGSGTFIQSNGAVHIHTLTLGKSAGATGTYSLSGPSSSVGPGHLIVGDAGAGTFIQSNGAVALSSLSLAAQPNSAGSYSLSNGSLTVQPGTFGFQSTLIVGDQGAATFSQTGGSVAATLNPAAPPDTNPSSDLILANSSGSSATYNLAAGSLSASNLHVGRAGHAYLRQAGGSVSAATLTLADQPGSSGTYDLLAGSLSAPSVTNNGTFYSQAPASLSLHSFTNNGSATLGGSQSWAPGSTFSNTLVAYFHSDPGSATSANLSVTSASPDWAPVVFDAPTTHLASLALSASTHASLPASTGTPRLLSSPLPTITDSAQLDLANNILLIPDGANNGLISDRLCDLLATSRLLSSSADADHRLAYSPALNLPASLRPAEAAPFDLVVTLALTGDINLDGKIDGDDYALLDHYTNIPPLLSPHWTNGDFNYDHRIDQQDYFLIDTTYYHQSHGFSPDFLAQRESQFGPAYVQSLLTSVPEPSSLSSILSPLSSLLLLKRRRRQTGPL